MLTNVKENVDRLVYNEANRAIYITRSGFGPHIFFNKFNGIKAMYCKNEQEVQYARKVCDINVLCLSNDMKVS